MPRSASASRTSGAPTCSPPLPWPRSSPRSDWFLVFWLRPLIKSIPFLPLGTVSTTLLVVGVIAFAIAGLLVAGAVFFANPLARWGDAVPGTCPRCGKRALRQEKVEYSGWEEGHPEAGIKKGPRGIVTLCETRGCSYAAATVTAPGAS